MNRRLIALGTIWMLPQLLPQIAVSEPSFAPMLISSGYVAGVDIIPLMPGLVEVDEQTVIFDKPEGRLVIARAEGPGAVSAAASFYDAALEPLGWSRGATTGPATRKYLREGEELMIIFEPLPDGIAARFWLSPQ